MNVMQLSRAELQQLTQDLRNNRIDLAQRIDQDKELFHQLPGDTFGGMCDSADRNHQATRRTTNLWHGGQAVTTLSGGYLILSSISLWHNGHAAVPMLIHDPVMSCAVGAGLMAAAYVCRYQAHQSRAREENTAQVCDRMAIWAASLRGAEIDAAARTQQSRTDVERLSDGLKSTNAGVFMRDGRVSVGGVQIKRRGES